MKNNKALSMIGLATRAGKVAAGEFSVETAIKKREAHLVIIAEDASENTKKQFRDMGNYRKIPVCFYGNKESLGLCTGRGYRASIAITDAGFANTIKKLIDTGETH